MTDDATFRIVAARTTQTVREVVGAQAISGTDAQHLGDLATAAVLYRETMAPSLRVQCIARGAGSTGTIVADSHPEGWVRGLIQQKAGVGALDLASEGALLQMQRSMPTGALHQGTVEVPSDGRIASAMMAYMQLSEQVLSMASVGTVLGDGEGEHAVVAAGGYLVQLLPESKGARGLLMLMSERMKDFVDLEARLLSTDASPEHLVEEIFYGLPFTYLESSDVRFGCNCSRERVWNSLATLPASDIAELVSSDEPIWTECEYCKADYTLSPEELRGLIRPS